MRLVFGWKAGAERQYTVAGSDQQGSRDPFDPENLKVNVDSDDVSTERKMTTVPVRRPNRREFFRVHPDMVLDTVVFAREEGLDREVYLVDPQCLDILSEEVRRVRLHVCINRQDVVFLWDAKLPQGTSNVGRRWMDTALVAAEAAKENWIKMYGKKELGGYEYAIARGDLGKPQWPDKDLRDLLAIAFEGRYIDDPDHPVIRELNGENL